MEPRPFDPKTDLECTGLEPWEVLQALFENTAPAGLGRLVPQTGMPDQMAKDLIRQYRAERWYRFDYVMGRPLKLHFVEPDDGLTWWVSRVDLYNRDAPRPAAQVIAELRAKKKL